MRFLIVFLFSVYFVSAQCPNNNDWWETIAAPTVIGSENSVSTFLWPGEYTRVTNMIAGNVYKISTCGEDGFDSEITIYRDNAINASSGYNDDLQGCNGKSQLHFSPFTTDDYDILLNEWPCDSNQDIAMYVTITLIETPAPIITIPVVVHVLYDDEIENISFFQIISQIDVLNEDFRRFNSEIYDVVPERFIGFSKDSRIEFCLASQDPNGNPTNGITRTQTDVSFQPPPSDLSWMPMYNFSGGHDAWNTQDYLNIWVCDIDEDGSMGYAAFPGGTEMSDLEPDYPEEDGIVIDYEYFGNIGTGTTYDSFNQGTTATHEVGHWLNLYHPFTNSCSSPGDYVQDTPYQEAPTPDYYDVCPENDSPNSCTNFSYSGYGGDMYSNFMDYTGPESCMQMFTYNQYQRMYYTLYGGYRDAIIYSDGCDAPTNTSVKDGVMIPRKLMKTIDVLGRETNNNEGFQLHIYDDGSVEKKYVIK